MPPRPLLSVFPLLTATALATMAIVTCGGDGDGANCEAGDASEARPLTTNDQWSEISADEDLFWTGAPEHARCGEEAIRVEDVDGDLWFDVTTEGCNYLTVSQSSLGCAAAGEDLTIWVFHYAITEGAGPYRMALTLGDPPEVVWEIEKAVPTVAGLVFEPVRLQRPIAIGEAITWHISNHGVNTWSLIGVFAGPPGSIVPGSRAPSPDQSP